MTSILEEAHGLIHGPRNKNYGHPRENFADIAALFSGYLGQEISDLDVANLMILVKVARVKGAGYHRDSYTDIAGYAGCAERIYEEPPGFEKDLSEGFAATPGREFKYLNDQVPLDVKTVRDADGDTWRRRVDRVVDTWDCDNTDKSVTDLGTGSFTEVLDGQTVSSRPSVYVRRVVKAPSPPPPKATVGAVTVDLMVHYPPTSEGIDIARASLASAYIEATKELQARLNERDSSAGS